MHCIRERCLYDSQIFFMRKIVVTIDSTIFRFLYLPHAHAYRTKKKKNRKEKENVRLSHHSQHSQFTLAFSFSMTCQRLTTATTSYSADFKLKTFVI